MNALTKINIAVGILIFSFTIYATPPLVTGDVPTADKESFELYVGTRYVQSDSGSIERQIPTTELVYGIMDRWEATLAVPYVYTGGQHGLGDIELESKVLLLSETSLRPGLALSGNIKFDNGNASDGLGSGGNEYELRLRSQKTFGWFTPIVNFGYTIVPDVEIGGINYARQNTWRASFAQEYAVGKTTTLLSEIYWNTSDSASGPDRFAGNVGFKQKITSNFRVHAAVGTSLRDHSEGGPELRVYVGFKYEFGAPWKKK